MTRTIEPRWKTTLKKERRVRARPPVIADDAVLQLFHYDKGGFYESSLLALDRETGAQQWRVAIAHIVNEPVVDPDGVIYLSSFEGAIYALDPNGHTLWKVVLGGRNMGAPAFAGTQYMLVAETGGRSARTWCLDPASGQVLWSFENGGHSYAIAATNDVAIHATVLNEPGSDEATIRLFALATRGGRVLWTASHHQYLFMPVLAGDHVVIGARGAILAYRVDNGRLEARLDLGEGVAADILVAGSTGLIAVDDTNVVRLITLARTRSFLRSTTDLRQAWEAPLPGKAIGRPIEINGRIAVMTEGGAIHLLAHQDGHLLASYDHKDGDTAGAGGLASSGDSVAAATGRILRLFRSADFAADSSKNFPGPSDG